MKSSLWTVVGFWIRAGTSTWWSRTNVTDRWFTRFCTMRTKRTWLKSTLTTAISYQKISKSPQMADLNKTTRKQLLDIFVCWFSQSVSDFPRNGHPEEETIRDEKGFFRHVKGISLCQPLHRRRTLSQCGHYRGYWRPTGSGWKGGSRLHPHGNVQHLHQSSWRIPSSDFCFFHVRHQCGWHWYKLFKT